MKMIPSLAGCETSQLAEGTFAATLMTLLHRPLPHLLLTSQAAVMLHRQHLR